MVRLKQWCRLWRLVVLRAINGGKSSCSGFAAIVVGRSE